MSGPGANKLSPTALSLTMFLALFGIVLFATLAMMVREGLWANLIATAAIVIGGLAAFGLYQPLTVILDEATDGSYTYLLDFVVIWLVFALVCGTVKGLGGVLSKTRLRFKEPINTVGGPLVGLVAGFFMASFTMATFHAAPLGATDFFPDLVGGSDVSVNTVETKSVQKVKSELDDASLLMRPDVVWLRFAESVLNPSALGAGDGFSAAFFVQTLGRHRAHYQKTSSTIVKRK